MFSSKCDTVRLIIWKQVSNERGLRAQDKIFIYCQLLVSALLRLVFPFTLGNWTLLSFSHFSCHNTCCPLLLLNTTFHCCPSPATQAFLEKTHISLDWFNKSEHLFLDVFWPSQPAGSSCSHTLISTPFKPSSSPHRRPPRVSHNT